MTWHDLVARTQNFWAPGFPSGAGDCVAMVLPTGKWADTPCGTVLPYICEEKLYGGSTLVAQVRVSSCLKPAP